MNILRRAQRFETGIAQTLERAARQWARSGPREPLEIAHAIVEVVAARIEPASRGRHVFPFNRLRIAVAASSADERARLAAVIDGKPTVQERIASRLREAGCDPSLLRITVTYLPKPAPEWAAPEFHVEFSRVAAAQAAVTKVLPPPELGITILHGAAAKRQYVFTMARVNLGRCAEVRDGRQRHVRTNEVVFLDGDDGAVNDTVSRRHAHIDYDAVTRRYRIVDDRSAHGTRVVRRGQVFNVPPGTRGMRLESGDEIALGDARVRVKISGPSTPVHD
jgi:hypothetical protein